MPDFVTTLGPNDRYHGEQSFQPNKQPALMQKASMKQQYYVNGDESASRVNFPDMASDKDPLLIVLDDHDDSPSEQIYLKRK
ncbi:hypothetical protein FGO68_gene11465 [Halteria grandinella]|uniref:Uncharacterized protein n=1 Tax=Halteria grandinella TaxID=5974 RepID=A0A8J8SXT2_HALGN|nr:hypothetical protein FGO68_gene11465 [Halteria grandinella]